MQALVFLLFTFFPLASSSPHKQLKAIDQLLTHHRNRNPHPPPPHIQKLTNLQLSLHHPVSLHESIKVSNKIKSSPNILLDPINNTMYNLDGEPLLSLPPNAIITSIRNQNMFVLTQTGSQVTIQEVKLKNNTLQLENVTVVKGVDSGVTAFVTGGGVKTRSVFLLAHGNGSVVRCTDKGEYRGQNDYFVGSKIIKIVKTGSHFLISTEQEIYILELFKALDEPLCSVLLNSNIANHFHKGDDLYIHTSSQLLTYSISRCQLTHHHNIPPNSSLHQLGDKIIVTKNTIAYSLDPLNHYSLAILNLKIPPSHHITTAKKSEYSTLVSVYNCEQGEVAVYEYSWQGEEHSFEMKGFKIPVMVIVFGIILYYSYKNKKQKQKEGARSNENGEEGGEKEVMEKELEGLEKLSPGQLQRMLEELRQEEKKGK